jgi:hypothetical protein
MTNKIAALGAFAFGLALAAATPSFAATMQCAPTQVINTIYPTGTTYTADAAGIVTSVSADDVNALHQAGCVQLGLGSGALCGELIGANMFVTTDQPLRWFVPANQYYRLTKITARNASRTFAGGTAAGGIYTGTSKPASPVVAASQVYTALTATNATANLDLTLVSGVGDKGEYTNTPLVFSLTTADGTAGTLDLFAYCEMGN